LCKPTLPIRARRRILARPYLSGDRIIRLGLTSQAKRLTGWAAIARWPLYAFRPGKPAISLKGIQLQAYPQLRLLAYWGEGYRRSILFMFVGFSA
jgi:hypothetical protein